MKALRLLTLLGLILILCACGDDATPPDTTIPVGPGTTVHGTLPPVVATQPAAPLQGLALEVVAAGLQNPVFVTAPPGDDRIFVLEQPGRVRIVEQGELAAKPFLDVSEFIGVHSLEQGLVGMAFHPGFEDNQRFFIYYTNTDGDTRVVAYRVSGDRNVADVDSAVMVLAVDQPAGNHNGGMLEFGPDGYLYVALGDGGGANDQFDNGQRVETLLGSLLRVDVDSNSPYAIPPDNPFVDAVGQPEIWAYGLRNPWRFSFDAETGLLYIADVGQSEFEEINIADADAAGLNYGWSIVEGVQCFQATTCDDAGATGPVVAYPHSEGCSVIGGYVYRGAAIPELAGHYFYGDWCGGWVKSFRFDGIDVLDLEDWSQDFGPIGQVLSFGQDGMGELYVTTGNGTVSRIVPHR